MHLQTHIMSGWCAANLLPLSPRQRLFCMIATAAPDLDGLGILAGERLYQDYHHVLGHNFSFALLVAAALAAFSPHRIASFFLYLAMFHLHLVMDYFGSGPLWKIYYLWPFSRWGIRNRDAWELYSWQNITGAVVFLTWVISIAISKGRTPLETLMPSLDRQLVAWLRRRVGRRKAAVHSMKFPS